MPRKKKDPTADVRTPDGQARAKLFLRSVRGAVDAAKAGDLVWECPPEAQPIVKALGEACGLDVRADALDQHNLRGEK